LAPIRWQFPLETAAGVWRGLAPIRWQFHHYPERAQTTGASMDEDRDYRAAIAMGLRRAALHWLRASYEVVAGVGALLNEVVEARKGERESGGAGDSDDGPVRIELD
jgi:hypothetical protein